MASFRGLRQVAPFLLCAAILPRVAAAQSSYKGSEAVTVDNTSGGVGLTASKIDPAGRPQATIATCYLESAEIRYTIDNTAPTASVGMPWEVGQTLVLNGHDVLQAFRAIRTGSTSGTLDCIYTASPTVSGLPVSPVTWIDPISDPASGSPDTGNPVKIGGYASDTPPTGVAAGSRVNAWFTTNGAIWSAIAGGTLNHHISTGTTQDKTQIKATAGTLVSAYASNSHATTDAYLRCTNATSANTTVGSTTVYFTMLVPAGPSGNNRSDVNAIFDTALTCYIVTGKAETDTTAVAANDVVWDLVVR